MREKTQNTMNDKKKPWDNTKKHKGVVIKPNTRENTTTKLFDAWHFVFVNSCQTLAVDTMMDVEHDCGASRKRRECWLRSWQMHERQIVRMVLAENLHHSSAPFSPRTALRGQCGQRPGALPDVRRGRHRRLAASTSF